MSTAGFLFMSSCSRISQRILGGFNQQNGLLFISIEMSYAWMLGALFGISHISDKFGMHLLKSLSQKGSLAIKAWKCNPIEDRPQRHFSMLHLQLDLRKKSPAQRYHHFNPPQSSTSPPKSHLVMSDYLDWDTPKSSNLPGWLRGKMGCSLEFIIWFPLKSTKKIA